MSTNPRRRGAGSRESQTTADATPTLAGMVRSLKPGPALDDQVGRAFARLGHNPLTESASTTWEGAQRLVHGLTTLGCYLEMQMHANRCLCRVLRVLKGNAISKQLASAEAPTLPEAIAKAALLTLLEMEPPE